MSMYNLIECSSNYSRTTGSLWFYSKDEATNFNADIANTYKFKSLKYKANLLKNTEADGTYGILKHTVSLKYLSNFWRSIEMQLINCKVELKLKWKKYCVLYAAGVDNVKGNASDNNIIFIIKDTKLYDPVVTLSARDNQKLSKILSKGFERSVYWNKYKTKSENKATTNGYRYVLESNFVGGNRLFALVYLNIGGDVKRFKTRRYSLPKGIIKNYNVIINGKNFYDQPIDSNIKRYEEIRKLTTRQGEDYTTGCLLDYDYIKNHYILIAVDLIREKELDANPKAIQQIEFVGQLKKTR